MQEGRKGGEKNDLGTPFLFFAVSVQTVSPGGSVLRCSRSLGLKNRECLTVRAFFFSYYRTGRDVNALVASLGLAAANGQSRRTGLEIAAMFGLQCVCVCVVTWKPERGVFGRHATRLALPPEP